MTNYYLKRRTVVIVIAITIALKLALKQSFLNCLIVALLMGAASLLISSFFRSSFDKVLFDKLAIRRLKKKDDKIILRASNSDHTIYIIDFLVVLNLPTLAIFLANNSNQIVALLHKVIFSNFLLTSIFILCFFYNSLILFIYRKRYYFIYTLLWISVPLSGALSYFSEILNITGHLKTFFLLYTPIMTCFIATVAALDYADKNIQEKKSILKKYWNILLDFLSWDFIIQKKRDSRINNK